MRGLAALSGVLEPARLHLAWRLFLRNEHPTVELLRARGAMPSKQEVTALEGFTGAATEVVDTVTARDGARRLVVRLLDGQHVESVVMGDGGVCVSTQVGCAVGCRFCASGIGGLIRNLTAEEILEQVAHARALDPGLTRVVYMGIGEPTHNLDAVLAAAEILARDGDFHERSQTLSTVGSTRALAKLVAARTRPSLALSIHAADDELRRHLLPHAPREPVADLVLAADAYGRATGREVQYAVALLAGVNDRDRDVDALAHLLSDRAGYVNVIPWNGVDGLPFARPTREHAIAFARALRERGIFTTLRWSAGEDADAACGQLRRTRVGSA